METELQQAERTAKAWLKWPAVPEVATLARVFLAQQARLADVERERDHWRSAWKGADVVRRNAIADRNAAERERDAWKDGKFAAVQRAEAAERKATEAAREALTKLSAECWAQGKMHPDAKSVDEMVLRFRDREYPAPTEREGAQECPCGRVRQLCGTVGCSNPANRPTPPQAAPEPLVIPLTRETDHFTGITLTPEDCRRIVAMAGFPVPEEGGR